MNLTIEKRQQEDSVILELDGELDISSSSTIRDEINQIIESGQRHIVLDMTKVVYMDSSGLGALAEAHKKLGQDGDIVLVGCRAVVERVLRFTQFDRVLELYRSFEDLEAGHRDNLRAVSGISRSTILKQKPGFHPAARRPPDRQGRRFQ